MGTSWDDENKQFYNKEKKMKRLLLIGLLTYIPLLGYSQMAVFDPAMTGITGSILGLLTEMTASQEAKETIKDAEAIAQKTAQAIDGIKATQKVIQQIEKVGSVAYALGENAQDTLDTFNEISQIFKSSPLTNKSLKDMTALDHLEGWKDYEAAKSKAIKGLTDFRKLDKNINARINNIWNTADLLEETIKVFGGTIDPTYTQLRNTVKNIEYGNRLTSELISILQGESALKQVNEELEVWNRKLQAYEKQERDKVEKESIDAFYDIDINEIEKDLGLDKLKDLKITEDAELKFSSIKGKYKKFK